MAAKTAANMVADAKANIDLLGPDQVAEELKSGDAVLVDLRDNDERRQNGSIPGAVHASRGLLEFYADPTSAYHKPELDPNKRVILHCASGGRSALAAKTLQEMGYSNVAHLEGGLNAWKEAGKPTES
jgi:rhodanese-related sulfurtransferase